MANLITLSRLLLLIVVVFIAYQPPGVAHFINVFLLSVVFITDGIDGYVARKRNETSQFGAMFDIAGDRIVELTMWIVLADLKLVPIWVPILFVVRGTIVDAIRASQSTSRQQSPFALIETPLGKWLVAGSFMRALYAVVKATAFGWLLLVQPLPVMFPGFWADWSGAMLAIANVLVYLAALMCIARGLPVIVEFVYSERRSILGRLIRPEVPGS